MKRIIDLATVLFFVVASEPARAASPFIWGPGPTAFNLSKSVDYPLQGSAPSNPLANYLRVYATTANNLVVRITAGTEQTVATDTNTLTLTNKSMSGSSNTFTNLPATGLTGIVPTANGGTGQNSTATFPTSGVVVTEAASETLTNKTINGASNTLTVRAASDITGQLPTANGGTAQNSTATFPTSGVVVTEAASETLTNKSMSGSTNTFTNLPATGLTGIVPTANGGTGQNSTATFPTGGVVVTEAATETLTNKTLTDLSTTIADDVDPTKKAQFQASVITTGTTRTFTFPDASTTILGNNNTATVLNKTLDSTNVVTLSTPNFTLIDNSDATKTMVFSTSGNGTNRKQTLASAVTTSDKTATFPDATTTLVGNDNTATLTNKTINGNANTLTIRAASDITGTLPLANGGTNATTKAGAFDSLSPMTTIGDIIYGGSGGTGTRLGSGTANQVLHSSAVSPPGWSAVALGADVSGTLPASNGGTGVSSTATFPSSGVVVTEAATETLTNKDISSATNTYRTGTDSVVGGILQASGTWTPALSGSTGNPTVTYVTQEGNYTRIGANGLLLAFDVVWSASSGGSGNFRISGLPYTTSSSSTTGQGFCGTSNIDYSAGYTVWGITAVGTSTSLQLAESGDNVALSTGAISQSQGGSFNKQLRCTVYINI